MESGCISLFPMFAIVVAMESFGSHCYGSIPHDITPVAVSGGL